MIFMLIREKEKKKIKKSVAAIKHFTVLAYVIKNELTMLSYLERTEHM